MDTLNSSAFSLSSWSPEHDNTQTYGQVCRLAAHRQCPLKTTTANNDFKQPFNLPNTEEEQYRDPDPHYECSAAFNTLPTIQNSPPSSYLGDGLGAVQEFERQSLPLVLSPTLRWNDLLEEIYLTSGPLRDSLFPMNAGFESPFPASDQVRPHTSYQPVRPIKVV